MATLPKADDSRVSIADFPTFQPHYTPHDMLELGVFQGNFFFQSSRKLWLTDAMRKDLFKGLEKSKYQSPWDITENFFAVASVLVGQIDVPMPIRMQYKGRFFEWYCKLYYGIPIDKDHSNYWIQYWRNSVRQLMIYIPNQSLENLDIQKSYRQALLHLGWDSTKLFT